MFKRCNVDSELAAKLADFGEQLRMKREGQRPIIERERREREAMEREEATAEAARWGEFLAQCEGQNPPAATVLTWPKGRAV